MSPEKQLTDVLRDWSEVFMRRSMTDFKRFMTETGLSFPQMSVLMRLFHSHHCSVSDVGTQLGVSNAAASQLVHGLVQMGYVEREEDPHDRRAKRLSLTPAGRVLIEQGIDARSRWLEGLAEALTPEQQQMIITALTLLTKAARATGR
ncbi:MAG: MarR family transcriptional regulator [Chloroflexi bacterium]|nr:MarR family transcriptional regulator [Chloroflexota bacterium]